MLGFEIDLFIFLELISIVRLCFSCLGPYSVRDWTLICSDIIVYVLRFNNVLISLILSYQLYQTYTQERFRVQLYTRSYNHHPGSPFTQEWYSSTLSTKTKIKIKISVSVKKTRKGRVQYVDGEKWKVILISEGLCESSSSTVMVRRKYRTSWDWVLFGVMKYLIRQSP